MKKRFVCIVAALTTIMLMLTLSGCSPKHNELFTVDKVKALTLDNTRAEVFERIGKPLAYDSKEVDWETHGYDALLYSTEDLSILSWYKARKNFTSNLPGFTENFHFTNKTWDRKHYTGVGDPLTVSPIDYILVKIVFKESKIFSIECVQYVANQSGSIPMYELKREA